MLTTRGEQIELTDFEHMQAAEAIDSHVAFAAWLHDKRYADVYLRLDAEPGRMVIVDVDDK